MIPEILDLIGQFAGTYFLLAVGRKPSSRQLLRDGGIPTVLEQILKTGGDIRMLYLVKDIYPDPELPIVKAVLTMDPFLARRICTIWDTWYSDIGYGISFHLSFTWGLKNLQPDEKTRIHFERLRAAKALVHTPVESESGSESWPESEEEPEYEEVNPYIRSTLEERLGMTTSSQVTDINYIACDFMTIFLTQIQEIRKFIEVNGVQHMRKIREEIPIQGPIEHAMWLINLCVDLGYEGRRRKTPGRSRVEPGVIYYKYPSLHDPDIACWMYFESF
ncbi:hypothetical protein [Absidia glauca]|uniref:Uncharacterized protein n=1 Tax=Absidia glauca TaxID=4829 RepID=A0A163JT07_ABSGL|nr:hypothetical protein [Absidia glauca]